MHVIEKLISELSKLPSIGRKSATRLAFHIIKTPIQDLEILANAIVEIPKQLTECEICCNLTLKRENPCSICKNHKRDGSKLIVVASVQDLMAIEDTANYSGKYHVLHGLISPLQGMGIESIRIKELKVRIEKENIEELILALTPNVDGETTAMYIRKILKNYTDLSITQIANGVPIGSELEYVDKITLLRALENRF